MKVSKKKYSIAVLTVVIAIIVSAAFLLALNIGIQCYIRDQSKTAVNHAIYFYRGMNAFSQGCFDEMGDEFTDSTDIFDKKSIFNLEEIPVVPGEVYSYDLSRLDDTLIQYYRQNEVQINKFELQKLDFKGESIYFAVVNESDEEYEDEIYIVYVNPEAVNAVVRLLNIMFIVVMIICILGASFIGIRAGIKMEDSEQKLRRFFSNASHELKTPLMSIQGYAEGIYSGICSDTKEAAGIILKQSDCMKALVEELLLLSKIQSGQLKLELESLNLCEIMDSEIAANEGIIMQKNIHVEIDFHDDIPDINGDEKQLYKAVNGIFNNAVKFTKDDIKVSVYKENSYVCIKIKDNGSGIAKEDMGHIFERFYYGKNGSTGIGLSLAKEIIEMHKGNIECFNQEGAVFVISIPIAD